MSSACCFVSSICGVVTFLLFGSAMSQKNAFLGYHGSMEEGAASCYKAAGAFGFLAVLSAAAFVTSAVRSKIGHGASSRSDYATV